MTSPALPIVGACYLRLVNAREKTLCHEALELPTKARARLAEVEAAWATEIDRRIQDVKEGRVKLIPAGQALRDVRAGLKRSRARRAR